MNLTHGKRLMGVASIVAVLVVTMMMMAGGIGTAQASQAQQIKPSAPLFIECQNTHWVTQKSAPTHTFNDGVTETVYLFSLRDTTNNAYCGQVMARNTYAQPANGCHTLHIAIRRASDGALLMQAGTTPGCGVDSLIQTSMVLSSGSVYASAWADVWPHDEYDTSPWTVS